MSQIVMVGTDGQKVGTTYQGLDPVTAESRSTGSHGMGFRMVSNRIYYNWFTQPFATGTSSDTASFKAGHSMVISVSNPVNSPGPSTFTFHKMATTTTYDTDINNMLDRIFALPFDSAVTAGDTYGGITQPNIYFILNHEIDAKGPDGTPGKLYYSNGWKKTNTATQNGTKDTAADFISAWQKLWNMAQTRAAAAGVSPTRIRWCLCYTSYGFQVNRVTQYYPGTKYVDVVGSDGYSNSTGTSFASVQADARTQCIAWNKPICYPEMNIIADDSAARASWWPDIATWINADTAITHEFINIWLASDQSYSNYYQYSINQVVADDAPSVGTHATPDVHAAIITMTNSLGGNPPRTVVGQSKPLAPTYPATPWVSGSDGTTGTLTINADPGGESVTGHKFFLAPGVTTNLVNQTPTPLGGTVYSYQFTGLTPGATYSVAATSGNAAGFSGYSNILTVQTINPGTSAHAPNITSATITAEGSNLTLVDLAVAATDPQSSPITYSTTIAGPGNYSVNFTTATTNGIILPGPGLYTVTWRVTNSLTPPLTTTQTATYSVPSTAGQNTQYFNFDLSALQPGEDPRNLGASLLGTLVAIDNELNILANSESGTRGLLQTVGFSFDPANSSNTMVTTAVSGSLIWTAICISSNQIQQVEVACLQPQVGGNGATAIGFYNDTGSLTTVDGTNNGALAEFSGSGTVDAWLQSAAGPQQFQLPSLLTGLSPGDTIWVAMYFPSGVTTLPTFRAGTAPGIMAVAGGFNANPRWGIVTGQSGLPTSLQAAWAAWSSGTANQNCPYIALY